MPFGPEGHQSINSISELVPAIVLDAVCVARKGLPAWLGCLSGDDGNMLISPSVDGFAITQPATLVLHSIVLVSGHAPISSLR